MLSEAPSSLKASTHSSKETAGALQQNTLGSSFFPILACGEPGTERWTMKYYLPGPRTFKKSLRVFQSNTLHIFCKYTKCPLLFTCFPLFASPLKISEGRQFSEGAESLLVWGQACSISWTDPIGRNAPTPFGQACSERSFLSSSCPRKWHSSSFKGSGNAKEEDKELEGWW